MIRKVLLIAFLSLSALVFVPETQAQMSLPQVRTYVDGKLAGLWDIILAKQSLHHQMYGTFFQGLMTHSILPGDGTDLYLDLQGASPSDQLTNWIDFLDTYLPADLPMALRIDIYSGPKGDGFNATVFVCFAGETYARSKAVGPEAKQLTNLWHKDTESILFCS